MPMHASFPSPAFDGDDGDAAAAGRAPPPGDGVGDACIHHPRPRSEAVVRRGWRARRHGRRACQGKGSIGVLVWQPSWALDSDRVNFLRESQPQSTVEGGGGL